MAPFLYPSFNLFFCFIVWLSVILIVLHSARHGIVQARYPLRKIPKENVCLCIAKISRQHIAIEFE